MLLYIQEKQHKIKALSSVDYKKLYAIYSDSFSFSIYYLKCLKLNDLQKTLNLRIK